LRLAAPAKINLFLWVGALRPDGKHEIESIMQSVSLTDDLTIAPSSSVTLDVSPVGAAPEDESNLVVAAVRALRGACSGPEGAALTLSKNIPTGAGLGGGSSDAAAALIGLNELWGCALSKKALEKIGAGLGADVPFCVRGGTAGARGAGERLAPLIVKDPLWWVIAMPPGSLSTADVYRRFDELGGPISPEADAHELADALARGEVERAGAALQNDLTRAAIALDPALESMPSQMREAGALGEVMSGSGPAWCGLARDADHAEQIASRLRPRLDRVWVARSLDRGAKIVER
jgi:4-diphosphocytidyl-2-C-methyl-D-erythritol kinase